jgi:hypothetical protein
MLYHALAYTQHVMIRACIPCLLSFRRSSNKDTVNKVAHMGMHQNPPPELLLQRLASEPRYKYELAFDMKQTISYILTAMCADRR